jgi:RNA polymerase sigma factor (TIGR02999 family)
MATDATPENAGAETTTSAQQFALVYDELRRIAAQLMNREAPGHTLQPTALVHEAWIRLIRSECLKIDSSSHFFAAAAKTMRRILVEQARRKNCAKRGNKPVRVDLEETAVPSPMPNDELLAMDEALEELATKAPVSAKLIELRFFAGLTQAEAARELGLSHRKAYEEWVYGRAFLYKRLQAESGNKGGTPRPSL